MYSTIISNIFVAFVRTFNDYGDRITPGACEIDDECDLKKETLTDRTPELKVCVAMSGVSLVYIVFLNIKYTEVGCCAAYSAVDWLPVDVRTKLQTFKRGDDALNGDALHRSVVYIIMAKSMNILL